MESLQYRVTPRCLFLSSACESVEGAENVPGLAQWVKDPAFCELWCRSQMKLGFGVAVAAA